MTKTQKPTTKTAAEFAKGDQFVTSQRENRRRFATVTAVRVNDDRVTVQVKDSEGWTTKTFRADQTVEVR